MATEETTDSGMSELDGSTQAVDLRPKAAVASSGDSELASCHLSRGDSIASTVSSYIEPALHTAVCNFDPKQVNDVLKSAAPGIVDPNERNYRGRNALHEGFISYVALHPLDKGLFVHDLITITTTLVEAGLEVNAITQDKKKRSLLHIAAGKPDNGDVIRVLFASGAKVNAQDGFHQTPLHLATTGGYKKNAEALLDGGADPNIKDVQGQTPLHLAAKGRHRLELLRLLLQCGAYVAAGDNLSRTPLHLAAKAARLDAVRELLLHDNLVNVKDGTGQTPLHLATTSDLTGEVLKELLEKDADVNIREHITGETALHRAVKLNMVESIKVLGRVKANPNVKDILGETPLHRAAQNKEYIVWTVLLSLGGDPTVENDQGHSAKLKVEKARNKMAQGLIELYEKEEED